MKRGIIVVVSGFSGAGKGTIMKKLMRDYDNYALSISATTRNPREGEVDGREYFFKTVEEFEEMIAENQLVEYAKYVNNYYGTPKAYVEEQLTKGKDVILEIEIQGALKIKEQFPEALLLFVMAPSADALYQRLVGRGTEDEATIRARINRAAEEAEGIESYDYVVVNDILEECVEQVHSIIQNEHWSAFRNTSFIEETRKQLQAFAKGE